jgi:nicotinamidase/pyrazinamidase
MGDMRALLIIGLQIDFLPGSEALAAKARELMGQYDLVVAGRFYLPANHLSFAANHPWRHPGQTVMVEGHPTTLQPMYCVQGSFGAEFVPGFSEGDFDFIADLGTEKDSLPFCAFYDAGRKRDTGLMDFLAGKNVRSLVVMGFPETVVANTVEVAAAMGFRT